MVEPFFRYCSATFTRLSLKITTRCHSVRSFFSPLARSRQDSEVARLRLATRSPELRVRISGSLPRLPTRMTLLTLPAMEMLLHHARRSLPLKTKSDHRTSGGAGICHAD